MLFQKNPAKQAGFLAFFSENPWFYVVKPLRQKNYSAPRAASAHFTHFSTRLHA